MKVSLVLVAANALAFRLCYGALTPPVSTFPYRISADKGYTDKRNQVWVEDTRFLVDPTLTSSLSMSSVPLSQCWKISGTDDDCLYSRYRFARPERGNSFYYRIPVVDGVYTVVTHHYGVYVSMFRLPRSLLIACMLANQLTVTSFCII
jgi:hypothetical protein